MRVRASHALTDRLSSTSSLASSGVAGEFGAEAVADVGIHGLAHRLRGGRDLDRYSDRSHGIRQQRQELEDRETALLQAVLAEREQAIATGQAEVRLLRSALLRRRHQDTLGI